MAILDKAKIGNSVQVNLELSKDRLSKEIIEAIKISSIGTITGYKITDGKGIGLILKLSNGKEQWFFEDEIDFLDESGKVIKRIYEPRESNSSIFNILKLLEYDNKNNIRELLNPANFILWLVVSFKDIF